MTGSVFQRHATAVILVGIVIVWEIVGRLGLVASGALPAPSDVIVRFWQERADYWPHIGATVRTAAIGFAVAACCRCPR